MHKYDCVLFDFDGTLSRSAPGVRLSLEKTVRAMNKPAPDLSDYSKYIGPPLLNTMKTLCGLSGDECAKGMEIYRDFYNKEGIYKNELYPGVEQALRKLYEAEIPMAVCSSKYEPFAKRACDILGITKYFSAVCGSTLDGTRKEKEDLIPYALDCLGLKRGCKAVLIGDTCFDAKGARLCGIDFIGAEYGYGKKELMLSQGAEAFVKEPGEIIALVM